MEIWTFLHICTAHHLPWQGKNKEAPLKQPKSVGPSFPPSLPPSLISPHLSFLLPTPSHHLIIHLKTHLMTILLSPLTSQLELYIEQLILYLYPLFPSYTTTCICGVGLVIGVWLAVYAMHADSCWKAYYYCQGDLFGASDLNLFL